MSEVRVRVNGEPRLVSERTTVHALLSELGALRDGVAVALNDELVLRGSWDATTLRPDDNVEVLSAAPGG